MFDIFSKKLDPTQGIVETVITTVSVSKDIVKLTTNNLTNFKDEEYFAELDTLRHYFEENFMRKTGDKGDLSEYERLRTIGAGAFGRVVSLSGNSAINK